MTATEWTKTQLLGELDFAKECLAAPLVPMVGTIEAGDTDLTEAWLDRVDVWIEYAHAVSVALRMTDRLGPVWTSTKMSRALAIRDARLNRHNARDLARTVFGRTTP